MWGIDAKLFAMVIVTNGSSFVSLMNIGTSDFRMA